MPPTAMLALPNGFLTNFKDVNDKIIGRHTNSPHHKMVEREIDHNKDKLLSANLDQIKSMENPANFITNTHMHAGM